MSARATTPPAAPVEPPVHVPKHQSFSWLVKTLEGDSHAEFVALTYDVCRGIELCLHIAQESELANSLNPGTEFLNPTKVERLKMMAIRSAQMLTERAEGMISDLNDAAQGAVAGGAN